MLKPGPPVGSWGFIPLEKFRRPELFHVEVESARIVTHDFLLFIA